MNLAQQLVDRFGVSHSEAERMIRVQRARAQVKAAVLSGRKRTHAADEPSFEDDPQAWRTEVQRRMQAIEVMEEGVGALKDLQKLVKRIIEAEQKLIAKKTSKVNHKDDDWWDMQHSGWAMGGREMFAQKLCDILNSLDESKLSKSIMDRIGFKRSIPIDEEDIAPLVPTDIQPGDDIPAYENPEAPRDAEDVEAMLVQGARRKKVTAGNPPMGKLWVHTKLPDHNHQRWFFPLKLSKNGNIQGLALDVKGRRVVKTSVWPGPWEEAKEQPDEWIMEKFQDHPNFKIGAKYQARAARKWYVFTWGVLGGGGGTVAGKSLQDVLEQAKSAGVEDYHEGHVVTVDAKNEREAIELIEADLYNGDFVDEGKVKRMRKQLGIGAKYQARAGVADERAVKVLEKAAAMLGGKRIQVPLGKAGWSFASPKAAHSFAKQAKKIGASAEVTKFGGKSSVLVTTDQEAEVP